jgi:integrase
MSLKKLPPLGGLPRTRIDYRVGSRRIQRVLPVDVKTARAVLAQKLRDRELQVAGGVTPKAFREAVDLFLAAKAGSNSRPGYLIELRRVLDLAAEGWGRAEASEISVGAIRQFMSGRNISPATLRKERAILCTFWRWCLCQGYTASDPMQAVEPVKVDAQAPRYLTPAEFRALWLAADEVLRPVLELLVATGLRAEEACSLTPESFRAGTLLLASRKARDYAIVPCPPELRDRALRGLSESPWTPERLRRAIQAAGKRAGMDDLCTHALRHTCATWLVAAGVSLWEVKRVLGHASVTTTERYSHLSNINWPEESGMLPEHMLAFVPIIRQKSVMADGFSRIQA